MKRSVLSIIVVLFALVANAQSIGYEKVDGKAYLEIAMKSENKDLEEVRILMNHGSAKKFLKNLQNSMEEANKLAATAHKKNVKNYKKTLKGTYSYTKIIFEDKNGVNIADYSPNCYLTPFFNVDSEGNSHLLLGGYFAGYDKVDSKKLNKFFIYVKLPVDDLENWSENFDVAIDDMKTAQRGLDPNERLLADANDLSNRINAKGGSKMPAIITLLTAPPYGVIILIVIAALLGFLIYKKKKN